MNTQEPALLAHICRVCKNFFFPKDWQIKCRDYRCLACKRIAQNTLNRSRPDIMKLKGKINYIRNKDNFKRYWDGKKHDPIHILKKKARRKVSTEIHAGRLKRKCCEKCGEIKTDAHHSDYSKPLDIKWLCRSCHISQDKAAMLEARKK